MKERKGLEEIFILLKDLPEERIKEIKDFIEFIKKKEAPFPKEKGALLSLMGSISNADAEAIKLSIEEACERIDINEW
ncbi:MAG: hypothetical protein AB1410_00190 [Acidobacteriota bacterium]